MVGCISCDDKGTITGCPICGKRIELVKFVPDIEADEDLMSMIPETYRDVWDTKVLLTKFSEFADDRAFMKYVKSLDSLVDTFQKGGLPKRSSIILSSVGLAKTRVAFYCMALAKSNGFSVGRLIDNTEYRRLNNLSTDNYLYKDFLKKNKHLPTIEEVVQSDMQFMTIDPCNFRDSYLDIMSLLSKRDRLGKPTIILSSFTISQITYSDFSGMFEKLTTNSMISGTKGLRRLEYFIGG